MKSYFKGFILFIISVISLQAQQIDIARIELMPNLPQPYEMRNWHNAALGYDSLVFSLNLQGQYLPLSKIVTNTINYPQHNSFGLNTVVGTPRVNSFEAINCLPAVISSSLVGLDKSNQNGYNWVLGCEEFFNKRPEENVYLNGPVTSSGDDWWYETMPNVFFYQLNYLYPGQGDFNYQFPTIADRWLQAVNAMGGSTTPWHIPIMYYRAFSLSNMTGNSMGVQEPEAAGAIGWILYNAYKKTGNEKYRIGAEQSIEFLNQLTSNPSYELQLPYGVYTAAKMNAELGTNYDIEKMLNWCFNVGPLRSWGAIVGKWGNYDASGLIGEISDNDYAFSMNTFELASAVVPLVRYDDRFARAIGKWMLNAANAARLFYPNYLPADYQDSEEWSYIYDPYSYIAHEALRQSLNGKSPFATGDAISGGWGATNLSLYSSSHSGIFGGIIDTTNVLGILKLNLLKTDYYHDNAYPTFLFYNPYDSSKTITINNNQANIDLYDAVSNTFLSQNNSGNINFTIPANSPVVAVLVPSNGAISYSGTKTLINNIVIDYNNGNTVANHKPRIKSLAASSNFLVKNDSVNIYCTAVDLDNDNLSYNYTVSKGSISGTGNTVKYISGNDTGSVLIKCIVNDNLSADTAETSINVLNHINNPPIIIKIEANPRKIQFSTSSEVTCFASDPDNDSLTYSWESNGGSFTNTGSKVIWNAPSFIGDYYLKCKVTDKYGAYTIDSLKVAVRDLSIVSHGNLIAFYPFNNNALDESGNNNNGTVHNLISVKDRFGNNNSAYSFDGVDSYINIPNSQILNFQQGITVNFWMIPKIFYNREQYPLSHGNWENRWKISFSDNKKLRWTIKSNSGTKDLDAESMLSLDSLYNIAATYDGSEMDLWINNKLDAFTPFSGSILTTSYDLTIGQVLPNNQQYNFNGTLDDIRLYDYALSPNEIDSLFITGLEQDNTNLKVIKDFTLFNNYPNPFNSSTIISFNIIKSGNTTLKIFDILGREKMTLVNNFLQPGYYKYNFDAKNLSSGVYIFQLVNNSRILTNKMILLK